MKKRGVLQSVLYILFFSLVLLLPIFNMNLITGKVSETENRELAKFPILVGEDGHLASGLREGFENWLGDNIGFRSSFVALTAKLKLNLFHQTTSTRVEIGRDGWYYLTDNHNVELATGEYILSEDVLQKICANQQRISNWYSSQGITYVLVLTAAKSSVYPEYIASRECSVRETLCDQVEAYLLQHSDVNVVNTKHALLENKQGEKLYLKTDTHWTQYGSYVAFRAVLEKLNELGVETHQFPVEFSEGTANGEFSAMLGVKGILGEETVPIAEWKSTVSAIDSGVLYETVKKLNSKNNESKRYPVVIYKNETAPSTTLLIYGDSQWMTARNLPQWMGEEFQTVVSTRFRSINRELDAEVNPQVVVFGCSERLIDSILTRETDLPEMIRSLPDIPAGEMISEEKYGEWIGDQGVCLESAGGVSLKGTRTITVDLNENEIRLQGWAADFNEKRPLQSLYLKIGEIIVECSYGLERTSISEHFGNQDLLNIGFKYDLPISFLKADEVKEISFYGVSADGNQLYGPVSYQLSYRRQQSENTENIAGLPDLPLKVMISEDEYGQWIGNQGVCLEKAGDTSLKGSTSFSVDLQETEISLQGWAADFSVDRPFQSLYVRIGDKVVECSYGLERKSIAEHFGDEALLRVGFKVDLPVSYLQSGKVTEIAFYGVSADGEYLYGPAAYQLTYGQR